MHNGLVNMMKQVFLVLILTLSLASPVVSALDKESTHYEQSHQGADFPVGWNDYSSGGPFPQWHYDWRMAYPAMNGGEGDEMAGNGPFPYVVFFGSDGESVDGYNGIANRLVQRGYIVLVTEDVSNFDDYPKILSHLYDLHLHMQYLTSPTPVVMGTGGNIQWTNWVLGGQGFGGASAF